MTNQAKQFKQVNKLVASLTCLLVSCTSLAPALADEPLFYSEQVERAYELQKAYQGQVQGDSLGFTLPPAAASLIQPATGLGNMNFAASGQEFPNYNLAQMRGVNPDFSMMPDTNGIIWLKENNFKHSIEGGVEREHLWVILGRNGLDEKWMTWNIPSPTGGSSEIVEASVYSFETLARLAEITPAFNPEASVHTVDFTVVKNMPSGNAFILVIAWREHMPQEIAFEDLVWFQESLLVWEAVVKLNLPPNQQIFSWTQPHDEPEIEKSALEALYTWRALDVAPLRPDSFSVSQRSGVAFSMRDKEAGLSLMMRDMENMLTPNMPNDAVAAFKKSGAIGLLSWLYNRPEITLAEGMSRSIPEMGPWTRLEKIILARKWLKSRGVDAALYWKLPMDPKETVPLCHELLQDILIEIPGSNKANNACYYDLRDAPRAGITSSGLMGCKIFGVAENGRLLQKQVQKASAEANKLSSIMRLKMDDQGMLSGEVRLILRGAWPSFLSLPLDNAKLTDSQLRAALLRLFPGLTNYGAIKYRQVKGVPELSFALQNKPGVKAVGGDNILLLPPNFVPLALLDLVNRNTIEQIDLRFPFVLEQDLEIGLPKNVERVLVSGKITRVPEKINYSEEYKMRRNRLTATSRLEIGQEHIRDTDISTLRQSVNRWRIFATKQLPVQAKKAR